MISRNKIILCTLLSVMLLVVIAAAVPWSPQGNIDLKKRYNITNLSYVESFNSSGNINLNGYNITSGKYIFSDNLNATQNVTARYFVGNGMFLIGVPRDSFNSTYNNYSTNVSINWTQRAITEGMTLFALLSENSTLWAEALNKRNVTYENYKTNVSINWTERAVAESRTLFALLSENATLWIEALNKRNGTYEKYGVNVSINWTERAIAQGDGRYWNLTLGSKNATYDLYAVNISLNWTEKAISEGRTLFALLSENATLWIEALNKRNGTYEKYGVNVSINWTEKAIAQGDGRYWNLTLGSKNATYDKYNDSWNFTYNNYKTNVSINWTARAITEGRTLFALLSENTTLWAEAKNKRNVTYENYKTNVSLNWTEKALLNANFTIDARTGSNGSAEWIKPEHIFDVDDADIETDLNTYVDIAGDNMTGNLNMSIRNLTSVDCIIFASGGKICTGV